MGKKASYAGSSQDLSQIIYPHMDTAGFVVYPEDRGDDMDKEQIVAHKALLNDLERAQSNLSFKDAVLRDAILRAYWKKQEQGGAKNWFLNAKEVQEWASSITARIRTMCRHFSQARLKGRGWHGSWVGLVSAIRDVEGEDSQAKSAQEGEDSQAKCDADGEDSQAKCDADGEDSQAKCDVDGEDSQAKCDVEGEDSQATLVADPVDALLAAAPGPEPEQEQNDVDADSRQIFGLPAEAEVDVSLEASRCKPCCLLDLHAQTQESPNS